MICVTRAREIPSRRAISTRDATSPASSCPRPTRKKGSVIAHRSGLCSKKTEKKALERRLGSTSRRDSRHRRHETPGSGRSSTCTNAVAVTQKHERVLVPNCPHKLLGRDPTAVCVEVSRSYRRRCSLSLSVNDGRSERTIAVSEPYTE